MLALFLFHVGRAPSVVNYDCRLPLLARVSISGFASGLSFIPFNANTKKLMSRVVQTLREIELKY